MRTINKKYQRPQIEVICGYDECGKTFIKDLSEVKRNQKRGCGNYCSLSCSGKSNHNQLLKYSGNINNFKNIIQSDKYTGLREHLRRTKNRNHEVTITLEDLLKQWIFQKGKCVYTGVNLIHPIRLNGESYIYTASLDRIDSSVGYIPGNIQFISVTSNMAKNKMSHDDMLLFCKLISENHKTKV